MGFEPTTLWLVTRCSTTELFSHWAKNQNRTDNLFITSEVLYQLSYFSILCRMRESNPRLGLGRPMCFRNTYSANFEERQSRPPLEILLMLKFWQNVARPKLTLEPQMGLEPITYWLQISCTANRAPEANWFLLSPLNNVKYMVKNLNSTLTKWG